jgi:AcrR family transcriptional regulator
MDTRKHIEDTITQMIDAGERLNIFSVAKKCGLSHSLIYNRYPDIKERIKVLKQSQANARAVAEDHQLIAKLVKDNKTLKQRVRSYREEGDEEAFTAILVHVQQLYSMYDEMLEDRNRLAQRLSGRHRKPDE